MAGRILSMQRQARELGRLRTGFTDTDGKKPRPVKSTSWIVTSHAEHYVEAAAATWGGAVENWSPLGGGAPQFRVITEAAAIDALLPPGDPLSQSYELWSGGGCARRCDGITETLADRPCLCRAEHGDEFHAQPKGAVCAPTTRMNVILPEMPDVGVFRVETRSYYAASEIAGAVDLIRSSVGPEAIIPIRLRIEQRQRKAGGQTKKFPVVVVELRGITTGQVLAGTLPQLAAATPRAVTTGGPAAIEAAPSLDVDSVRAALEVAATLEELRALWPELKAAGLEQEAKARAAEFATVQHETPIRLPDTTDPDELWATILRSVPEQWTTTQVEQDFARVTETEAEVAGAPDMRRYLEHLAAS